MPPDASSALTVTAWPSKASALCHLHFLVLLAPASQNPPFWFSLLVGVEETRISHKNVCRMAALASLPYLILF